MNQATISDINEMDKGYPVAMFSGSIKKAFEPNEGETKGKPWKMQAVILKDDTGEIRATFWNRFNTDFRNLEDEDIVIVTGKDKRGKPAGLLVDEYNGKKQLKVSEIASFSCDGASDELASEPTGYAEVLDNPIPNQAVPAKRFVSEETKRESIEKQVALKAAVDFYAGKEGQLDNVITAAKSFYNFLHGDATPEATDEVPF